MRGLVVTLALGAVLVPAAWGANPPANTAFTACLKKHGVTLGKTTDQKKLRAAFVACRAVAPAGAGTRPQLSKAQRAAFAKYRTCLAQHGVKLAAFAPGRRGTQPQRPPATKVSAKVKAAQKACASLRPKFAGRPPGVPA
jgi:hypothetical protein